MSDANVSPIVGQEVWAAVSVVFCVAVILVFFFILCCAYRRHRRVRDSVIFTPPVLDELGNHSAPWVVCNAKDKHEGSNKWTSQVQGAREKSSIFVERTKERCLEFFASLNTTKKQQKKADSSKEETLMSKPLLTCLFTFTATLHAILRTQVHIVYIWSAIQQQFSGF